MSDNETPRRNVRVPTFCPVCEGDGSVQSMFDVGCDAAWTHDLIAYSRRNGGLVTVRSLLGSPQ